MLEAHDRRETKRVIVGSMLSHFFFENDAMTMTSSLSSSLGSISDASDRLDDPSPLTTRFTRSDG
jgi:hypothetical protein